MAPSAISPPGVVSSSKSPFDDDDDDEGWQDMPVIRPDTFASSYDEADHKKYHYVEPSRTNTKENAGVSNATGNLIDFDDYGNEWREKQAANENEYTRLRLNEENEADEVHLRTRYLFDEDKAMTPLSQMQQTKNMLTEAQRVAYVGLCALIAREMTRSLELVKSKELKDAIESMKLWAMKIMGRLYYHMELETQEQKMIESLSEHGVLSSDLVPALMTTHTVANPEYDPLEAKRQSDAKDEKDTAERLKLENEEEEDEGTDGQVLDVPAVEVDSSHLSPPPTGNEKFQTTTKVLAPSSPLPMPGVSTSLSAADQNVTLDIRWTVLCDLFLILIADSVYDARSRVLLENVAVKLGLGWLDVVRFEQRVTEALEIQEGVEKLEQKEVIEGRVKAARRRRYAMMGLATLGGGLVIGLSAGLLAPVIGAGLGAAFTTIGVTGTTGFLAGAGGAAVITTAGTLTGSSIAARGMARRTQQVRTFDLLPMHNNKRVNCIVTVSGFMTSSRDDVRLPFSVVDPIVGDVFSVLWEPEMLGETGSALKLLTTEVLSQVSTTVLQATVMTALMSALQWPILLTKLGYLIDNPWSNALDRAKAAGSVLADVLIQRHLGVRPITLIGFSLGARLIFYCLLELAKQKALGIVQDVFILGATLTAPRQKWLQARSVVSGRFVNGYARNDWVLNYLFRATSGGLSSIAGLRPVQDVPGLENVDVTDKIAGHMSYRTFMPLILDQLGFPVSADFFDEPEEPDFTEDRIVVREGEEAPKKKGWFSQGAKKPTTNSQRVSRPPGAYPVKSEGQKTAASPDDDLPERTEKVDLRPSSPVESTTETLRPPGPADSQSSLPIHAGFDFNAIKEVIGKEGLNLDELREPGPMLFRPPDLQPPSMRSESAPPLTMGETTPRNAPSVQRSSVEVTGNTQSDEAGPSSRRDLAANFARSLSMDHADGHPSPRNHPLTFDDNEEDNSTVSSRGVSSASQIPAAPSSSLGGSDRSLWSLEPQLPKEQLTTFGNGHALNDYGRISSPSRPEPAPTLSFGGSDGTVWAPDRPLSNQYDEFGATGNEQRKASFSASTDTLTLGDKTGNMTFMSSAPPMPYNPFSTSTAALSFGGQDGSVSSMNIANDGDPWRPPPLGNTTKKAATTLNSNPWQ
ncbi:DUF726-domain-containing protein [Rickenella mellea]|uniref:DUF726-domain-containing protein n=1 Tax=Rickenella mellea TaxID=50990 RepID=A0A4Y7QHV4_9AGAM|nr:DUF726-domain-containing protein [Rickenella mellea]